MGVRWSRMSWSDRNELGQDSAEASATISNLALLFRRPHRAFPTDVGSI
jgi:hypothetical protein